MADAVNRLGLFDSYAETGEVVATTNIFCSGPERRDSKIFWLR
jgi:hypothetical protein